MACELASASPRRGCGTSCWAFLQDTARLPANLFRRHAQPLQDIQPDAFILAHEAEQQMLSADVVVAHAAGFFDGKLENLLGPRRQLNPAPGVPPDAGKPFDHFFDTRRIQTKLAQDATGNAAFLPDKSEQKVLGADVVVVHPLGLFMSQAENSAGTLCEALHFVVGHSYLRDRLMLPALACPILPKNPFRPAYEGP